MGSKFPESVLFFSLGKNTDALQSSVYYPDKMERFCLFHCTLAKHKSDLVTEKVGQTSAKTSFILIFHFVHDVIQTITHFDWLE